MRIALVILHADATRGGAERYTLDLAAALARDGHNVSLLSTSFADVPAGVTRVELAANNMTRSGRYRRMLDSLDAHLDANDYDVVHAMLPVQRCDVYHPHAGIALAALERRSIRFNPRRKTMAHVERDLLTGPRAPVVLCLSDYVKRSVIQYYPGIDDRLATLFNAVDLVRFTPAREGEAPAEPRSRAVPGSAGASPSQRVNALFVGNDFVRKGLIEAIAAMRSIENSRLRLTVVGRKPWGYHLPPMPDIIQAGSVSDTRPFYREADFFVLPTKHDPCSLVVLEALAMGVPVISTRFNGACEIMTDGVHGFVLDDPEDVNALAAAMRKMLDPELRDHMSRACLELRSRLSYEHHLRALLGIYQQVLQSHSS